MPHDTEVAKLLTRVKSNLLDALYGLSEHLNTGIPSAELREAEALLRQASYKLHTYTARHA